MLSVNSVLPSLQSNGYFYQQVYIIGLGVSIAKKRKSVVDEELDSSDYDSDEDLVSA